MRKELRIAVGIFRLAKEKIWNTKRLKTHGISYYIGKNVRFYTAKDEKSILDLGTKTWIGENSYFSASGGSVRLGYNNFFNSNTYLIAKSAITVGDNNLFGPNVVIVDHDHQYDDPNQLICKQGFTTSPITIGSNIWIGANVIICQGVSICDRVVVAGNAVVTKPITESGVYGGIPAHKIKDI